MSVPHSVELLFDPVYDLTAIQADGAHPTEFQSGGNDPQFDVRAQAGLAAITPGWWRVRGRLAASDGWIITPRFYADYGDGYNERDCVPLREPSREGSVDSVVFIRAPLRRLRFDPTVREARFRIEAMSMTRLSRPMALARLLHGVGSGLFGSWRMAVASAGTLLRDCILSTPSLGAQALLQRYLQAHALPEASYDMWYRMFEPLHAELSERALRGMQEMATPPEIAVLLRVGNPRPDELRRCLDSVLAQTWPRWRLAVSLAAESPRAVEQLVKEYAARESRITLRATRPSNSSVAPEDLLSDITEAYVGFLDPDAMLAPDALCEFAHAIEAYPDAGLFYSDADRVDASGRRFDPCLKPNWNPSLLLAENYIGHFLVATTAVLRAAGGIGTAADGGHHDLALRCTALLDPQQIRHIPKIVYHASGTRRPGPREGRALADRQAVEAHLARASAPMQLARIADGRLRATPVLPDPQPLVTIIVPTRDRVALLRTCIDSVLARTLYPRYEILVVDNGSVEGATLEYLDELGRHPKCRVLPHPAPFNFSAIVNAGAQAATGTLLCLLNNDIEVISPDWLGEMAAHAAQPDAGAVGAMLYYPDDTIQHGGVILGIGGVAGHIYHRSPRGCAGYQGRALVAQDMSAVTGACLVVRRSVFEHVGGFDEGLAVAFNDIDFCLKLLKAGYRNLWTPHAELYHHESVSRGHEDTPEKRARFACEVDNMILRWGDFLNDDPAYNPNLTLHGSHFQLSFPPRLGALETYRQRVLSSAASPAS